MRKLVVLIVVVFAVFAYYNRDRLFVRDPLGFVMRDGTKEKGAQVFINYNNDVLLENDNAPMYFDLFMHGKPVSAPDSLKCIHYLVCLANGYPAPQAIVLQDYKLETMTKEHVEFRDGEGREVVIALR
jgi:hypothetical protein